MKGMKQVHKKNMIQQFWQERAGIVIAAPKSGSGKTLVTCALIQALCNRNLSVCSYKCGPDYIDPMFHRTVLGVPGGNLDTYFTGREQTRELFFSQTEKDDFAVVEGVMGLFDGIGGTKEEGSTYDLADTLRLPIILVVDAHGMGCSILPLIAGFLSYDIKHQISGVILNRASASFYPVLEELIRQELSVEVLGYFPEMKNLHLESRHLGLKMPEEVQNLKAQVQIAAKKLEQSVNLDRIIELGKKNFEPAAGGNDCTRSNTAEDVKQKKPILAFARDEAFCFYYQENLAMLKKAGFEIRDFSPIHDSALPEGTCAILLGGGYPELYARELSENVQMKEAIQQAIANEMPLVAECGGFMYLHRELVDEKGISYQMTGVLDGRCDYKGKLVRFGYVSIQEHSHNFLKAGECISGHEFHYYDSTVNGTSCTAKKPTGSQSWDCVHENNVHWWGFPHLYYPSNPSFVEKFYQKAIHYCERNAE